MTEEELKNLLSRRNEMSNSEAVCILIKIMLNHDYDMSEDEKNMALSKAILSLQLLDALKDRGIANG